MARPGQKARDIYTAAWYNEVTKNVRTKDRKQRATFNRESFSTTIVYNHEAVAHAAYSVVGMSDKHITDRSTPGFETGDITDDNWVVLQEPLDARIGASAEAVVVGCSWLNLGEIEYDLQTHIRIVSEQTTSANRGRGYIMYSEVVDDETWVFTALGINQDNSRKFFKLTENAYGEYGPAWAVVCNREGVEEPSSDFLIYWWDNILDGGLPSYKASWEIDSEGTPVWEAGKCLDTNDTASLIEGPNEYEADVDVAFTIDMTYTGMSNVSASGLPPGVSLDGSDDITGTVTSAGTHFIVVTGDAPLGGGGTAVLTKRIKLVVS